MTCNTTIDCCDRMIMTKIKRRWSVRLADRDGQITYLMVSVPKNEGTVHLSVGGEAVVAPAERIERMRQVLDEARAAALWERGSW